MREFLLDGGDLIQLLKTDQEAGLTSEEAGRSAAEHGVNELSKAEAESLFARIWRSTTEPMILMLIAAGIIALIVNIIRSATGGAPEFLECLGIFTAIALSIAITVMMESKSARAFWMKTIRRWKRGNWNRSQMES